MTAASVHAVPLAPATRLRLTRRGRLVFTALAGVPLVLGALALVVNGGAAGASDTNSGTELMSYTSDSGIVTTLAFSPIDVGSSRFVTVEPGQTLWDIAEQISPSDDPRDIVADIKRVNSLSLETLQPGQRLQLPSNY